MTSKCVTPQHINSATTLHNASKERCVSSLSGHDLCSVVFLRCLNQHLHVHTQTPGHSYPLSSPGSSLIVKMFTFLKQILPSAPCPSNQINSWSSSPREALLQEKSWCRHEVFLESFPSKSHRVRENSLISLY